MSYKVNVFGVQVERASIKSTNIPESLNECIKRDIEALLVTASGFGALQKKADENDLIDLANLQSVEDCRNAAIKIHQDRITVENSLTHLHLMMRDSGGNSYTAAWLKRKINNPEVIAVSIKGHDVVAINKIDGQRSLLKIEEILGKKSEVGIALAYESLEKARKTSEVLIASIESSSDRALAKIAKTANKLALNNYSNFDVVDYLRQKFRKFGQVDIEKVSTYPSASEFHDLFYNYKKYVNEHSSITISNEAKIVSLLITGQTIYQGINLGRCNINEAEAESIKKKLTSKYHREWLSTNPTETYKDVEELGITFDELNQDYFTNSIKVVASASGVAVVPAAPVGMTTGQLAEMVAVEILEAIKKSRPSLYEILNRYSIIANQNRVGGVDPRIVVMVANKLDDQLGTVFSNVPLTKTDQLELEQFLQVEYQNLNAKNQKIDDEDSVVLDVPRGSASMSM